MAVGETVADGVELDSGTSMSLGVGVAVSAVDGGVGVAIGVGVGGSGVRDGVGVEVGNTDGAGVAETVGKAAGVCVATGLGVETAISEFSLVVVLTLG